MIDASDSETKEGLETGEIVADSVGFMLAGYETTSTTLTFATYLLAANPEAQERLANEIHEYFELNPVSVVSMNLCVLHILIWFDTSSQSLRRVNEFYDSVATEVHNNQCPGHFHSWIFLNWFKTDFGIVFTS